LRNREDEIVIGEVPKEILVISSSPVAYVSPIKLDEEEIQRRRNKRKEIALGSLDVQGITYAV
jgi:hypothetical protein